MSINNGPENSMAKTIAPRQAFLQLTKFDVLFVCSFHEYTSSVTMSKQTLITDFSRFYPPTYARQSLTF